MNECLVLTVRVHWPEGPEEMDIWLTGENMPIISGLIAMGIRVEYISREYRS